MEKYYRPYSSEEIKDLRSRKHSMWQHFEHFGMKWVFITLILITPFLLFEKYVKEVPPEVELPILIVIEIIVMAIVLYLIKRMGELDWNRIIETEIREGEAEVIKLKTDRVVKRKDPEDFGSGLLMQS